MECAGRASSRSFSLSSSSLISRSSSCSWFTYNPFFAYTADFSCIRNPAFLFYSWLCPHIYHPDRIGETKPDYVLILPWNLQEEIVQQVGYIREWGGRFVVPIPEPRVLA